MINSKTFMLCNSITEKELPNLKGNFLANIKYDGERCISMIKDNEVFMLNRRGKIITQNFPEIEAELKTLDNCIIDGEVIAETEKFEDLQRRALIKGKAEIEKRAKEIPCRYMVFDILQIENLALTQKPLQERIRELCCFLDDKILDFKHLFLARYEDIDELLDYAKATEQEGIVIKNMNSPYESRRSANWLKLKFFQETTIIVTKYTTNPAGIRCETNDGIAIQVSGSQHKEVKQAIDEKGGCIVNIQYLTKTETGKYRFPSFRGVAKEVEV